MSLFTPEQIIASHKANIAALFTLTNQAFDRVSKLVELNLQTVRVTLVESGANLQEALSSKTPEEFLAWRTNLMQPAAEQALSYSRQLADIGSSAYAEWVSAVRVQYEHRISTAQTLVDNSARNAPAGTEVATAMLQSAFATASSAGETVREAAKRAIETAKGTRTAKR